MKFNIDTKNLLVALKLAARNVTGDIGIGSMMRFFLRGGVLAVSSTDGAASAVSVTIGLSVEGESSDGCVLVPGKFIVSALAEFGDVSGGVVFESSERTAVLTWDGGRCEFPIEDSLEWPRARIPAEDGAVRFSVEAPHLRAALSGTVYASSTDGLREGINAVNFRPAGGTLVLAATNATLLATYGIGATVSGEAGAFSIPIRAAALLKDLLKGREGQVGIITDGKNISVTGDGLRLDTYAVPHRFPAYAQIFERKKGVSVVDVPLEDLARSVRRLRALSGGFSDTIRLQTGNGELRLSLAGTAKVTDVSDSVPAGCTGEDVAVTLKASLFDEALSACDFATVRLAVDGPSAPCFIEDADRNAGCAVAMMPLADI